MTQMRDFVLERGLLVPSRGIVRASRVHQQQLMQQPPAAPTGVVQVIPKQRRDGLGYNQNYQPTPALTAGDAVLIPVSFYNPAGSLLSNTAVITVTANGTAAPMVTGTAMFVDGAFSGAMYFCASCGSGADGVRVNLTGGSALDGGASGYMVFGGVEMNDLTGSPIDATGLNNGTTSTTPSSGSFSISSANARIFCLAVTGNGIDWLTVNFNGATEIMHESDGNNSSPCASAYSTPSGTTGQGQSYTLGVSTPWKMSYATLLRV